MLFNFHTLQLLEEIGNNKRLKFKTVTWIYNLKKQQIIVPTSEQATTYLKKNLDSFHNYLYNV